jgi:hypothetical protein
VFDEDIREASPEEHHPPDGNLSSIVWKLAPVIETCPYEFSTLTRLPLEPVFLEVSYTNGFVLLT